MSLNKVILFICCSLFTISYAQQGNDIHSLLSKTPEQLEDYFSNITEEKRKSEITDSVLMEVKKSNNLDFRFKGYFLKLLENSHKPLSIKYADSILYVANRKKDNYIKALGNLYKGIQLYYQSEHVEALSYYLKAQQYFKQNKDEYYTIKIRHYIGLLKNASGNEKQALTFFKKNISFFEKDLELKSKYGSQYIKSLFALGESYNRNSKLDSANVINKIGLKESLKLDKSMYPYFLLTYGATMYYMEKPELGIDSLLKATKYLNEKKNSLSDAYRLISLSYKKMDNDKSLLQYLLKIDSVHTQHPNTVLNAQWANSELYNYHKKIGNKEKQLENINKLLSIDSIVETKYSKLEKKITEGYDIPNLLSERENLISTLKQDSNSNQKTSFIFIFLSFSLLLVLFYFLRKNYILRRRFQFIIQDIDKNEQPKAADKIRENEEPTKEQEITAQKPQKTSGISKDLTEKILLGLDKFEKSQRFTKKKYTLNSLAKELNTNSTYLSKVINLEKGTNFSNYLNNLKIDYAINRLTKDSKFRSYTIKAISEESGFNNQLTFSIAFNKKTKLQPSYFIKQLEKK